MAPLIASFAMAGLLAVSSATRASVDVSFGWRFQLGKSTPTSCASSDFPTSLDGQRVLGLSAASATDAASCMQAACAQGAELFQWCTGAGAKCGAASCWIGDWPGSSEAEAGWVSSRNNGSVPMPTPPEAAAAYDDSKWNILDLPHDFEVTGVYAAGQNGGEGFLPYNVSFYRKHVALPAAWTGSRVELYVEGALSASKWWLNGVELAGGNMFMTSYTALILRLDNSPAIVWGGQNVIVGFIDGTKKTGWW